MDFACTRDEHGAYVSKVWSDDSTMARVLTTVVEPDPMEAKYILLEAYQQDAGIFNHLAENSLDAKDRRPLAVLALHDAENIYKLSSYATILERYVVAKVWDYFHLSLTEFLDLPETMIGHILESCQKLVTEDSARLDTLKKGLK